MSDMSDSMRDDPMDEYAPFEADNTPMVDFDLELGAAPRVLRYARDGFHSLVTHDRRRRLVTVTPSDFDTALDAKVAASEDGPTGLQQWKRRDPPTELEDVADLYADWKDRPERGGLVSENRQYEIDWVRYSPDDNVRQYVIWSGVYRASGTGVGISLPEADLLRVAKSIKALDTWVESVKAQMPENMYNAWKLWAKGTNDAIASALSRSRGLQAAVATLPVWPAGGIGAVVAAATNKGATIDAALIAGEATKLQVWRETFRSAGLAVPGMPSTPAASPPTAMQPQYAPSIPPVISEPGFFSTTLGKGAMIGGGLLVALLLWNALVGSKEPQAQPHAQEG